MTFGKTIDEIFSVLGHLKAIDVVGQKDEGHVVSIVLNDVDRVIKVEIGIVDAIIFFPEKVDGLTSKIDRNDCRSEEVDNKNDALLEDIGINVKENAETVDEDYTDEVFLGR